MTGLDTYATGGMSAGDAVVDFPRLLARLTFVGITVTWVVAAGFPGERLSLLLWLWLASLAWSWGRPLAYHLDMLKSWGPVVATLVVWTYSKGMADNLGRPTEVQMPIDVDTWLGGGQLLNVRLQEALCAPTCHDITAGAWYDGVLSIVYISHFLIGIAIAVALWVRLRSEWSAWMRRYLALNLIGLAGYIVYPMAPPWMASDLGAADGDIPRMAGRGLAVVGVEFSQLAMGPIANPVAAMPSLHAATACLVTMYAITKLRSPLRWVLISYPVAMAVALVYFGEHYVVDIAAGVVLAAAVMLGCRGWERWRARRQDRQERSQAADVATDRPEVLV